MGFRYFQVDSVYIYQTRTHELKLRVVSSIPALPEVVFLGSMPRLRKVCNESDCSQSLLVLSFRIQMNSSADSTTSRGSIRCFGSRWPSYTFTSSRRSCSWIQTDFAGLSPWLKLDTTNVSIITAFTPRMLHMPCTAFLIVRTRGKISLQKSSLLVFLLQEFMTWATLV
mmetsp:Transcript_4130/g.9142  ORF Transcript_4130/g.9142 Transcript_4130/m.9142 type:complete len:169 (+) Transcript_4130:3-509(+)